MPSLAQPQKTRRIYLNVIGEDGNPVGDLSMADVQLREASVPQKITRLALSNHPMRIALLVDTSAGANFQIADLRAALGAFFGVVPPPHEVLFVTTGVHEQVRVQPTADRMPLMNSAQSLFPDTGGGTGTALFDALDDVDGRFMKKAGDKTPVYVIVTGDGFETSQRFDEKAFDALTRSLQARDVPVYGVVLSKAALGTPASIAVHLANNTQGHIEMIGSTLQLVGALKKVGTLVVENDKRMATWYEVEFTSTSNDAQPLIEVQVLTRQGMRTQLAATRHIP
jgi:hypothetical protein